VTYLYEHYIGLMTRVVSYVSKVMA